MGRSLPESRLSIVWNLGNVGDGRTSGRERYGTRRETGLLRYFLINGRFARAVAVGSAHHIKKRGVDQQRVSFTDAGSVKRFV
jgi:hypothetical protein